MLRAYVILVSTLLGKDIINCLINWIIRQFIPCGITHWHPSIFEVYDEVCSIGKLGSVMVLCSTANSGSLMFYGSKADCPYSPDKKYLLEKYYYLEAK